MKIMKRSLKLKKIKISKINNIMAGAIHVQGNYQTIIVKYPVTYTLDTKLDDSCQYHTNGGTLRTVGTPVQNINDRIPN